MDLYFLYSVIFKIVFVIIAIILIERINRIMNELTQAYERGILVFKDMERIETIHGRCVKCNGSLGSLKRDYKYRNVHKSCVTESNGDAYAAICFSLMKKGSIPVEMCSGKNYSILLF